MECSYCEKGEAVKCTCGHFACREHTYFVREDNILKPVCIACYEEAKSAYESSTSRYPE